MTKPIAQRTIEGIAMYHVSWKKKRTYFHNQPAVSATDRKSKSSLFCSLHTQNNHWEKSFLQHKFYDTMSFFKLKSTTPPKPQTGGRKLSVQEKNHRCEKE